VVHQAKAVLQELAELQVQVVLQEHQVLMVRQVVQELVELQVQVVRQVLMEVHRVLLGNGRPVVHRHQVQISQHQILPQ
jgi:hypothetical protein